MIVGNGAVFAWNGDGWREVARSRDGVLTFDGLRLDDETAGMTIDELLDDIDSALADHRSRE